MLVYPNPATEQVTLKFYAPVSCNEGTINIYSMEGKLQQSQIVSIIAGENNVPVNVSELPMGVYLVELNSGERKVCERVVVK